MLPVSSAGLDLPVRTPSQEISPSPKLVNLKAGRTEGNDDLLTGELKSASNQVMCVVQINTQEGTTTFFDPSVGVDLNKPNQVLNSKKLATVDEDGKITYGQGFSPTEVTVHPTTNRVGTNIETMTRTVHLKATDKSPAVSFSIGESGTAEYPVNEQKKYTPNFVTISVNEQKSSSNQAGFTQHSLYMDIEDGSNMAAGQEVSNLSMKALVLDANGHQIGNTQSVEAFAVSDHVAGQYADRRIDHGAAQAHGLTFEDARELAVNHKQGEWKDFSWTNNTFDFFSPTTWPESFDPQTNGRLVFTESALTPFGEQVPIAQEQKNGVRLHARREVTVTPIK